MTSFGIIWNVAHLQATIIARSIGLHPTLVLTLFQWVYPSRLGAILSHFFPVGPLQGATQNFSPVATPKVVKVEWICTLTSISKAGRACTVLSSMSTARDQCISYYRSGSCPVWISPHINFWKSLSLFSWKYTHGFIMDGNFKAEHLHDRNSDNQVSLMDGLGFMVSQNPYKSYLLCSQCNLISSSAHSSVVWGHAELLVTWFFYLWQWQVGRLKSGRLFQGRD